MADLLLDTTAFIDYWRGDVKAKALIDSVLDRTVTGSFSSITAFELWFGALGVEEESLYESVLLVLEEAPLTASGARQAALWLRALDPDAAERLLRDALIAATASERREAVCTRNVSDFRLFYANVQPY